MLLIQEINLAFLFVFAVNVALLKAMVNENDGSWNRSAVFLKLGAGRKERGRALLVRMKKYFFCSNPYENTALRAGVVKNPKLFCKNVLDVSRWFW